MRTALLTGASSGFGHNLAVDLANRGWRVFAGFRDPDQADGLVAETCGSPGAVKPLRLDVTLPESVEDAVRNALDESGGAIDAVVSNAGYGLLGAFEDLDDRACRHQMEVNFFGAIGVVRKTLPSMRERGSGRVVLVSSNACNAPHPMLTMYAASKWALEGWAEGLAMEVAPFGIDVVVVQPGAHRTSFAGNVRPVVPADSAYGGWMAAAAPGIAELDAWGRDPERARATLLDAVVRPGHPFRTSLGEDAVAFAALKAALPFEARAALLRAIVGLPGPGAFGGTAEEIEPSPVSRKLAAALASDGRLLDPIVAAVAPAATATH